MSKDKDYADYYLGAGIENRNCSTDTTHYEGCYDSGPRHYKCALREVKRLQEVNTKARNDMLELFEIKNRFTGEVLFSAECESLKICVEAAVKGNTNLYTTNLYNADLSNADLSNANLRNAYLYNADLSNANLRNADLSNADLSNADLSNANLRNANLRNANLYNADLSGIRE